MKDETSGRVSAFDELGAEFARVAAAEQPIPVAHLRLRRAAVALAVTLTVVPAGFALAQSGSSDEPAADTGSSAPEAVLSPEYADSSVLEAVLNDPVAAARIGTTAPIDIATLREYQADLEAQRQAARDDPQDINVIGDGLPSPLVEECRANPNADNLCGIALAAAGGKLPSGTYTDEELQQAVRDAGYEWTPSD